MSETSQPPPLAQRILLVTDAWAPQVNGVVRTLERLVEELRALGCVVEVIAPSDGYRTVPLVTYSEIRLALGARGRRRSAATAARESLRRRGRRSTGGPDARPAGRPPARSAPHPITAAR
jgi:hypothetical protein